MMDGPDTSWTPVTTTAPHVDAKNIDMVIPSVTPIPPVNTRRAYDAVMIARAAPNLDVSLLMGKIPQGVEAKVRAHVSASQSEWKRYLPFVVRRFRLLLPLNQRQRQLLCRLDAQPFNRCSNPDPSPAGR